MDSHQDIAQDSVTTPSTMDSQDIAQDSVTTPSTMDIQDKQLLVTNPSQFDEPGLPVFTRLSGKQIRLMFRIVDIVDSCQIKHVFYPKIKRVQVT